MVPFLENETLERIYIVKEKCGWNLHLEVPTDEELARHLEGVFVRLSLSSSSVCFDNGEYPSRLFVVSRALRVGIGHSNTSRTILELV